MHMLYYMYMYHFYHVHVRVHCVQQSSVLTEHCKAMASNAPSSLTGLKVPFKNHSKRKKKMALDILVPYCPF